MVHFVTIALLVGVASVQAADFTIVDGQVVGQQTLATGETGIVEEGGTISTSGAVAIDATGGGSNMTIINRGTVTATGVGGTGIESDGNNASITNSGSITTTGAGNEAIKSSGANATIINSGTITTSGSTAEGIQSQGNNATIDNSGTVKVTGAGAIGILFSGTNATLTNSGTVSATGSATTAIQGSANADTLNLNAGSEIIGLIDLQGGTDTVIFGANTSAVLNIANAENVSVLNGGTNFIQVGNIFTVVDPTGQSVNATVLGSVTAGIHGAVTQHLAHSPAPPQLASTRVDPGMLSESREPKLWVNGFGSHRERGQDGLALAYDHDYYGFAGGYETNYRQYRVGFIGGYAHSDVVTDIAATDNDSDSFFVGGYGQVGFGQVDLSITLLAGYERHDNDRRVVDSSNGIEIARSEFGSFFLSPSLTLSGEYEFGNRHMFRPSATVVYSVALHDDYTESGGAPQGRTCWSTNGFLRLSWGVYRWQ